MSWHNVWHCSLNCFCPVCYDLTSFVSVQLYVCTLCHLPTSAHELNHSHFCELLTKIICWTLEVSNALEMTGESSGWAMQLKRNVMVRKGYLRVGHSHAFNQHLYTSLCGTSGTFEAASTRRGEGEKEREKEGRQKTIAAHLFNYNYYGNHD